MVSENLPPDDDQEESQFKSGNTRVCLARLDEIDRLEQAKELSSVEGNRQVDGILKRFEAVRGIPLSEASKKVRTAFEILEDTDILENAEKDLLKMQAAIAKVKGLDMQKKNRWLKLIDGIIEVQRVARENTVIFWVYVGRTSEKNEIFDMAPVHIGYFDIWEEDCNSLIMAPPGHGKTTSLRGRILKDICDHPERRILILYDTDDKAQKEVMLHKAYLNSGRLQALYPDIYVLDRKHGAQNSSKRFTVHRKNVFSREPSIECAGIGGAINGNGYDEIVIDDPCPETVATQPAARDAINTKFNVVVEERLRDPANSRIRMICTPWHSDDLAGKIQKDVSAGKRHGWKIEVDRFKIKEDEDGNYISIWPQRYTPQHYKHKRDKMTNNEFARLYQMKCIADAERVVKHVHYYPALGTRDPLWKQLSPRLQKQYDDRLKSIAAGEIWLSVDPSATSGKTSSNTGITKFSLTATGQAYVVEACEMPGNPMETQDYLVDQIINHGVHRLLLEAQGGMTGMVALWITYIRRRLRELAFDWKGSIIERKTQGHGGGQNIGKTRRLQNTAAYIENGYLMFPGKLLYIEPRKAFSFVQGSDDGIITLTNQILDFSPSNKNDGLDTVTQFLIEVESRLPALTEFQQAEREAVREYEDPITRLRKMQMQALRHPKPNSDPTGENKWNLQLVG